MSNTLKKELSGSLLSNRFLSSPKGDTYDFSTLNNDEEIKEITLQLVMIRKAYDHVLNQNSQKREQIDLMKKQILKLESTTETCTEDQSSISSRIKQLYKEVGTYKNKLEKESQDNKSLEYVLLRTKNDLLNLEMKSLNLHSSLTSLKTHLQQYEKKSMKSKEQNSQSQRLLKSVSESVKIEQKSKEKIVKRLEKAANSKKEASERRQKRIVKQAEIAEIAANEDRNSEEIAMKEQIIIYKIYWMLLNFKQDKAFRESEDAEEAFKRIRVATGLSNIQTVIEGFLKRHELAAELQKSISEQDKQLSSLKKKCDQVRNELNSILLISKESSSPYFSHLQDLNKQIMQERKDYEKSTQLYAVYERIYSDLEDLFKKIQRSFNLSPDKLETIRSLNIICKEVAEKNQGIQKEIDEAENTHISNLIKSFSPGKDFKTRKEVILEEQHLSLEDNN